MGDFPTWITVVLAVLGVVYAVLFFLLPVFVFCIYHWVERTCAEAKKIRELLERAVATRPPAPPRLPVAYPKDAGSRPAPGSP